MGIKPTRDSAATEGRHLAVPTKNATETHSGLRVESCDICRTWVREHLPAMAPSWSGKPLLVGDQIRVRDNHYGSRLGWMTVESIRFNSFTGEMWIHPFEASNSVLKAEDIVEVRSAAI